MTDRLTVTEVARAMLNRQPTATAVELTRNAKGDVQISVKVTVDGDKIATPQKAYDEACRLFNAASKRYPKPKETKA